MNCDRNTDAQRSDFIVEHVTVTEEVDDVPDPPPGFKSDFKTLEEWLVKVCTTEAPQKPIATFRFGLSELPDDYMLFVVGLNEYFIAKNHSATRIDFAPANMYFTLPKNEYKDLKREQVIERVTTQLKDFIKTDQFRHSFFAKSETIITDFSGKIWSKYQ